MPWEDRKPMDHKIQFIADYTRLTGTISELCYRYGISRKTGHKWIKRYNELGFEGLPEQSRRPSQHPGQTPFHIRKRIVEIRQDSVITPGAKKIRARLQKEYSEQSVPSISTINNVLKAEGLTKTRRKRRRVSPYGKFLQAGKAPNDLWSVDFKGQFKLTNGRWCYPLTVMDDYSRYLLAIQSQDSVNARDTRRNFKRLFCEYGLPYRIRSDNGVPFATTATAGLSLLSIWWIRLGIHPERIERGKPQQNGRHERMHRTLKAVAVRPPSRSFKTQQARFDQFLEAYNEERTHESLSQQLPCEWYQPSTRPYPSKINAIEYPRHFSVRKVKGTGVVYWHGGQAYISNLLADERVGIEEIDNDVFDFYFSFYRLGTIDISKGRLNRSGHYWSIKV